MRADKSNAQGFQQQAKRAGAAMRQSVQARVSLVERQSLRNSTASGMAQRNRQSLSAARSQSQLIAPNQTNSVPKIQQASPKERISAELE